MGEEVLEARAQQTHEEEEINSQIKTEAQKGERKEETRAQRTHEEEEEINSQIKTETQGERKEETRAQGVEKGIVETENLPVVARDNEANHLKQQDIQKEDIEDECKRNSSL